MAGVKKGSSDNLTSPIPHLLNADFLTAAARLTAGQVHYPGRDYYQRDTDTHYRLLALAKCFLADGVTAATQAGTWGTLEAHWSASTVQTVNAKGSTTASPSEQAVGTALAAQQLAITNLNNLAVRSAVTGYTPEIAPLPTF